MPKINKKDKAFPSRLQRLLDEKHMTKADLARKVWGEMVDERGYTVARNRQTLGRYLAGQTYPTHSTRIMIAEALGVPYAELFPSEDPTERVGSGVTLEPKGKSTSHLTLDVDLPTDVALDVIQIVRPHI